jgi:hypothetical protein
MEDTAMNEMPKVIECLREECAYNAEQSCHALAITIGDGDCPMCDTELLSLKKGGSMIMGGSVGACKVTHCQYNDSLECSAGGIRVMVHKKHADCGTFKKR